MHSLRQNFDFAEIWHKRNIAIRDLSPKYIYYPEETMVTYYEVFSHPEKSLHINGHLIMHRESGDVELPIDIDDNCLTNFSPPERIQILALHKLADARISQTASETIANAVDLSPNKIILNNGQSLICSNVDHADSPLSHKAIIVDPSSKKSSKVGDFTLQPGQATYGIFSNNTLVAVAPPFKSNNSFHLEYELVGDIVTLIVTDTATNMQVTKYGKGHFFCLLGENDFVVIDGLIVSCFNNEDLNNRLRQDVVKSKSPEIIETNGDIIKIIYKDQTTEIIQI